MKWLLLIILIVGIVALANWSYHQLDHAILITDYWETTERIQWRLVNFQEEENHLYAYAGNQGYWPIFKGLWPVWALFSLIFLVLTPFSVLIYKWANNVHINSAIQDVQIAERELEEAKEQADKEVRDAEKRVDSAYKEQKRRVRAELDSESQSLHQFKNELLQRENTIKRREIAAQKIQDEANHKITEIQQAYADELQRFKTKTEEITKARDNAQAGYQRLKSKIIRKQ